MKAQKKNKVDFFNFVLFYNKLIIYYMFSHT